LSCRWLFSESAFCQDKSNQPSDDSNLTGKEAMQSYMSGVIDDLEYYDRNRPQSMFSGQNS
jgi:hypothetical protein